MALVYSGNFKIFKNALGQFIPNRPPKHVFTSTNSTSFISTMKYKEKDPQPIKTINTFLANDPLL